MSFETVFTMDTSSIKYGPGATAELGYDMKRLGGTRVMLVTDPNLSQSDIVSVASKSLADAGIEVVAYDRVHIEPTDVSFKDAIAFAGESGVDGYVAVGGGSTMDTAKVANLYTTWPADFLEYVNPPVGQGQPVPGPLRPLIAVPTTAGTGSETTGVAIFDFKEMHVKTGIAHRSLRPNLGIVDPDNTRTLPPMVTACCGFDVLCHALESLTALPYHQRTASEHPGLRPAYNGANPISDVWVVRAIEMVTENLLRVLENPENDEARGRMLLASTFAGIGFGNAGVHLPHAMSYPVAGMVRDYDPDGYGVDHPLVPHGMSVVLNAPAVFKCTAQANPALHLQAAGLMGVDVSGASPEDAGELLSDALVRLMRKTGIPNGLSTVGFSESDVDQLVDGTLAQQRLTKLSPRPVEKQDLQHLFRDAMTCW